MFLTFVILTPISNYEQDGQIFTRKSSPENFQNIAQIILTSNFIETVQDFKDLSNLYNFGLIDFLQILLTNSS